MLFNTNVKTEIEYTIIIHKLIGHIIFLEIKTKNLFSPQPIMTVTSTKGNDNAEDNDILIRSY